MPAMSERQKAHLKKLNSLWQTESQRFRPGGKPWNMKNRDLPRDKYRRPIVPCEGGCGKMVCIYSKTHRCKDCAYKFRSEKIKYRIWKNGYAYSSMGSRPKANHILIAEKTLKRSLKKGELVHHINLHKDDNRNKNLLICDSKYHKWLHYQYTKKFAERSFDYVPSAI